MKPGAYPDGKGNPWLSVEEYDAIPALRSSVLKIGCTSTWAHARAAIEWGMADSPDKRLGDLLHVCVLEPERWAREYVVNPHHGYQASDVKKAVKAAWLADHPHVQSISQEEHDMVIEWRKLLYADPEIRHILTAPGHSELSLVWIDQGVLCKCRIDRLTQVQAKATKAELKSCLSASPWKFAKRSFDLGYYIQDAFYLRGINAVYGERQRDSVIIALEKGDRKKCKPPLVALYRHTPTALMLGNDLCSIGIQKYAECVESGEWPGYPRGVQSLELPRYAYSDDTSAAGIRGFADDIGEC